MSKENLDSKTVEGFGDEWSRFDQTGMTDEDIKRLFEGYFSGFASSNFESTWIFLKGDLYRFREGRREQAIEKFETFWTTREKSRWSEIHNFMREYTAKSYREKEKKKEKEKETIDCYLPFNNGC